MIYNQIFADIATKYGKAYTSEVHTLTSGTTQAESLKTVIKTLGLPVDLEELTGIFLGMQAEGMQNLKTMPGKINVHFRLDFLFFFRNRSGETASPF